MLNKPVELIVTDLSQGLPAITPSLGAALAEACAVCLDEQGHSQGVEIIVKFERHSPSDGIFFVLLVCACFSNNTAQQANR